MKKESSRLLLSPLRFQELNELITNNEISNEKFDFTNLELSSTQRRAINIKMDKMRKVNIENHDWYTYWIIINKCNLNVMGLVGFKGLNEQGEAEVGYGISKKFEGNGYMTEAVGVLVNWAFENDKCNVITATNVLSTNLGSQRVLTKNGFKKIDESEGTIDYILIKKM